MRDAYQELEDAGRSHSGIRLPATRAAPGTSYWLNAEGIIMERPMSIVLMKETTPTTNSLRRSATKAVSVPERTVAAEKGNKPPVQVLQEQDDAGSSSTDHQMRLPSFDETCPHVRDHIIPLNGGHFNVDHYLRVLRAKAERDVSIAMAMTAGGQRKTATPPSSRLVLLRAQHLGGAQ